MGRLTAVDVLTIWLCILALSLLLTSSAKYSFVLSVFGVVNFFILVYWFAIPPPDETGVRAYLEGFTVGAHRGLADDAPENTLGAFRHSKKLGADCVELDLEFSSEGAAVIFHDDVLDRTTDGTGPISAASLAHLSSLNAAKHFPRKDEFPFEKIPTLEEAMKTLIQLDVRIIIDVKNPHHLVTPTLLTLYREHKELYERAAVCSFFPNVVYDMKRADPNIITGHTWRPGFFAYKDIANRLREKRFPESLAAHVWAEVMDWAHIWFLHSWMWKFSGASLVLTQQRQISANYVSEWARKGLQVVSWTSNSVAERIYFLKDLGIPILTDRLSDFQEQLAEIQGKK